MSNHATNNNNDNTNNNKHENNDDDDEALSFILKKLRPFQREAYDFCCKGIVSERLASGNFEYDAQYLGQGRILLADEMGLGKSVTSLAIMTHFRRQDWPLLILCPASLRHTWPGEIETFLPSLPPSAVYVVQGFDDADFYDNAVKRSKIQIVVATYSLLQTRSAAAHTLQQFQFQSIIADESHNLKQKNSQRAQLALPLLEQAKRLCLLSGTPALARPVELWTQISTLAPGLLESNYTRFTKRFCNARRGRFGWDVNGLSNAQELHIKLKQIMVRRLKANVLQELPPKQRSVIPIQLRGDKKKDSESIVKELLETRQSVSELVGDEANSANFEARRLLMQAYQASGIAKSAGVCDYLLEWLRGSGSQKVLIFAHHKGVLDALEVVVAKEYKGTGHIRIDGSVNCQERAVRVRKFQTCSQVRVAILSMTAAGVGLTLTAATTCMFAELHWTPGVLAQAEDRCHRIGQRNAVNILYLVCRDTNQSIDMQLWNMLGRKIGMLGRVVDGEKNASMNAKMQDPADTRGGQSVQDELQQFFAGTSPDEPSSAKKKIPVKGTILSFFQKQKEQSTSKPSKKTQPASLASKTPLATSSESQQIIEWACETCTFLNSKPCAKSGYLTRCCTMCGSAHFAEEPTRPTVTVTPPSISDKVATPKSSSDDPIVIDIEDGNDDDALSPKKLWKSQKQMSSQQDPIILDDHDEVEETFDPPRKRKLTPTMTRRVKVLNNCQTTTSSLLTFSVSENSGRITIHYSPGNESSMTNFEIEQVVTKGMASLLMEAKIRRCNIQKKTGSTVTVVPLEFDSNALQRVINNIDRTKLRGESDTAKLRSEIEQFVSLYQGLREVEKKAIRESGQAFPPFQLKQACLRLLTSSTTSNSTQRYSGGAKERAQENLENGTADSNDMRILEGDLCAWCGGKLPSSSNAAGVSSTYCSRECAQDGRLKRGGMFASSRVREQVFCLEGGICRICGVDAHALYTRICALQPAERLNALCNANWKLPKTSKSLERLLQDPKECDFWQADHIQAVSEGGGGCGLENLQTLCVPCHAQETEKLRARLKLSGGSVQQQISNNSDRKQQDIRSMFQPASSNKKKRPRSHVTVQP